MRKIVFIVSSYTSIGVLESQVFQFAKTILSIDDNVLIDIYLIGPKIKLNSELNNSKISMYNVRKSYLIPKIKNSKVYFRTIDLFLLNFIKLKKNKNHIIYDFRALLFSEVYFRKNYIRSVFSFFLELIVYLCADSVCAVSKCLKKKLHQFFVIKKSVFVMPSLIFNETSPNLSLDERFKEEIKFVYMGGLSKWQKTETIIEVYKKFKKSYPHCTLTILTRDNQNLKALEKKFPNVFNSKSLNNEEVLKELKNYHFGFLLRDNILLNNVSSPIKFMEYLNAGVIPILSDGIGDYSQEIEELNTGILLPETKILKKENLLRLLNDKNYEERRQNHLLRYNPLKVIVNHPLL